MYPKTREVLLVAKSILSFAIDYQTRFSARMLEMRPALEDDIMDDALYKVRVRWAERIRAESKVTSKKRLTKERVFKE